MKKQASDSKIMPLGDRVLVKPFTKEELTKKTDYGIIVPESSEKEKSEQGKVIAVGEGTYHDGKLVPVAVKAGDTVIFSKYGYDEVKMDDEEYFILKEDNILAVIK